MDEQLGIPRYFLSLSCADLRWEEFPYIIHKLNNLSLTDEELKMKLSRMVWSFNNPVVGAKHCQYEVEVFFKEIILDSKLGETKYYATCIEFKEIVLMPIRFI